MSEGKWELVKSFTVGQVTTEVNKLSIQPPKFSTYTFYTRRNDLEKRRLGFIPSAYAKDALESLRQAKEYIEVEARSEVRS